MTNVDVSATAAAPSAPTASPTGVAETRIDAAHGRPDGHRAPHLTPTTPALASAASTPETALPGPAETLAFVAQLRSQATELAEYLARRQGELDDREATLHARAADLEKQSRAARLWVLERQHDLQEHRAELGQAPRRPSAEDREAAVVHQQLAESLAQREKALAEREAQWAEACERQKSEFEAELWRREAQWQSPSAEQVAERRRLEELAAKVREREQRLSRGESLLSEQQAEVEARARQCDRLRAELDDLERSQRQVLAGERQRSEAELARRKLTIDQRGEELDVRTAAVEQLRSDLTRLHRETLEMRLATEELWAQLSGAMAPAALTQSLARVRAKLADYYKLSERELEARQQDLSRLATKVAGQHDKLAARRQQVENWAAQRQAEIEQQAGRLAAREQELARVERKCQQRELDWQSEREGFQQEIRRLMREIRRSEAVGAA